MRGVSETTCCFKNETHRRWPLQYAQPLSSEPALLTIHYLSSCKFTTLNRAFHVWPCVEITLGVRARDDGDEGFEE